MSYLIYADVSIDIAEEVADRYDIRYVPMEFMIGSDSFTCEKPAGNEFMHEYYEKLRQKVTTHTSQITPNHYRSVFEPLVKEGQSLIYLSLSSGLSDTYSSACVAVQDLKEDYEEVNIEVVDTLGATGGMGILAEMAAKNREAGMTMEENVSWLRAHVLNLRYWFKVEDLMYLKRGGRVSAATAIVGTALNIKPILDIAPDGRLETLDKKRGNKQASKALLDHFESTYDPSFPQLAYICCADCMEEADKLKEELQSMHPELTIHITMLSPIIGAHTGPDMLSLIHFGSKRQDGTL